MKSRNRYHDVHKVKVYKDFYRPSSNLYRFVRSLLSVLVAGESPAGGSHHYQYIKKK